jgi:hypothetical protein
MVWFFVALYLWVLSKNAIWEKRYKKKKEIAKNFPQILRAIV